MAQPVTKHDLLQSVQGTIQDIDQDMQGLLQTKAELERDAERLKAEIVEETRKGSGAKYQTVLTVWAELEKAGWI
jgi:hypothetical protein